MTLILHFLVLLQRSEHFQFHCRLQSAIMVFLWLSVSRVRRTVKRCDTKHAPLCRYSTLCSTDDTAMQPNWDSNTKKCWFVTYRFNIHRLWLQLWLQDRACFTPRPHSFMRPKAVHPWSIGGTWLSDERFDLKSYGGVAVDVGTWVCMTGKWEVRKLVVLFALMFFLLGDFQWVSRIFRPLPPLTLKSVFFVSVLAELSLRFLGVK